MKTNEKSMDRRTFLKTTGVSGASLAISCGLAGNILAADAAKGSSASSKNTVDDEALNSLKDMLGYTEDQWETWKSNPRNFELAEKGQDLSKYKLVAEITSAYGCGAGHKVGDKIVFSGGSLLCKENPEQICFGLLSAINPYVSLVIEKVFTGEDPTKIAFNKAHCPDVGVNHGGWGEVILDIKVEKVQA